MFIFVVRAVKQTSIKAWAVCFSPCFIHIYISTISNLSTFIWFTRLCNKIFLGHPDFFYTTRCILIHLGTWDSLLHPSAVAHAKTIQAPLSYTCAITFFLNLLNNWYFCHTLFYHTYAFKDHNLQNWVDIRNARDEKQVLLLLLDSWWIFQSSISDNAMMMRIWFTTWQHNTK